jgi:hypothetical protein
MWIVAVLGGTFLVFNFLASIAMLMHRQGTSLLEQAIVSIEEASTLRIDTPLTGA